MHAVQAAYTGGQPWHMLAFLSTKSKAKYAATEQNIRLDKNAQADYELMTYLNHADILVSADTRFQLSAFVALWKPHGKKLLTPEEFVAFIDTFHHRTLFFC